MKLFAGHLGRVALPVFGAILQMATTVKHISEM